MNKKKIRLDRFIAIHYPHLSKTFIQSLIMQGKVKVNGIVVTKSGTMVASDVVYQVDLTVPKYVSRAGFKLEKVLDVFNIDVSNFVVLDAGLSTGGFTDCLLQHGAQKVYGVDVGYGQVHEKIARDARVIVIERTNLRKLGLLPEKVDLVTLDLSFISILKVMDTVLQNLKPGGSLIILIKPQFEAEKHQVGKGGIIKDPKIHKQVISKVVTGIQKLEFDFLGIIESPILGAQGNKEFLVYFKRKNT